MNGPKDKFRVDMWKGADRTVNCRYNPEVVGKYTVNIKWEDEHIKVGFTSCPSLLLFSVLEILCMRWAFQWDFFILGRRNSWLESLFCCCFSLTCLAGIGFVVNVILRPFLIEQVHGITTFISNVNGGS